MLRRVLGKLRRAPGRLRRALSVRAHRIREAPPNYAFCERFRPGDVAIDVGTGYDPDFSRHLMAGYKMECYAVDPTRKHAPALRQLEGELGSFHYLQLAVGADNGTAEFHESEANISGSLLKEHRNVVNDPLRTYQVEVVTLGELIRRVGRRPVAIVKLDVEGVEYDVIRSLERGDVEDVGQLLVEFHHGIVAGRDLEDTRAAIRRLEELGFRSFLFNGRDCLFYR